MKSGKINPVHWFGAAFTAVALLCLFGMAAAFFIKTDGSLLGILLYKFVLGFTFAPALLICSVPAIWGSWQLFKRHRPSKPVAATLASISASILIASANLPYFLQGNLQGVPYELLVVLSGVVVNIAVFAWLTSSPNQESDIQCR